jgi:hypothetical protein
MHDLQELFLVVFIRISYQILYTISQRNTIRRGRSMRTRYLSLIAMSVYCFYAILLPLWGRVPGILVTVTGYEQLYWLDEPSLLAFIALCGGITFLLATRNENPSWYLGIPLCLMFAITALSPLVEGILVIRDMTPPIYHPGILWTLLSQAAVFLIPLCAALFFWSQKQLGRYATILTGIALLMALGSLVALYFSFLPYLVSAGFIPPAQPHYVDGYPVKTHGEGMLFLFIHLIIGLPVTGLCFLALAVLSWNSSRKTAAVPLPSPEALA